MRRASLFFFATILAHSVSAEEVYKWTDSSGKVHYSTTPRGEKAELPPIQKQNFSENIKRIKAATPPNCERHGGIDCVQGADSDGSVICLDGYRDAIHPFRFQCLEARLRPDSARYLNADDTPWNPRESDTRPAKMQVSIRNLTPAQANGVTAEVVVSRKVRFPLSGPDSIEAYGVGEYSFAPISQNFDFKKPPRVQVSCRNCSTAAPIAR